MFQREQLVWLILSGLFFSIAFGITLFVIFFELGSTQSVWCYVVAGLFLAFGLLALQIRKNNVAEYNDGDWTYTKELRWLHRLFKRRD